MNRVREAKAAVGVLVLLLVVTGCDKIMPQKMGDSASTNSTAALSKTSETVPAPVSTTQDVLGSMTIEQPKLSETQTIARINGQLISTTDFELRIEELKLLYNIPEWVPTTEEKEGILNDLVQAELMAADVIARGALRSRDVQARLWYVRRRFLADEWARQEQKHVKIGQQEIETFYNANKAAYSIPGNATVRQAVLGTKNEANQVLRQLLDGADFTQLAKTRSIGPLAAKGGEIGVVVSAYHKEMFRQAGQELPGAVLFPKAESVVFALDEGGVSQVVEGPGLDGNSTAYFIFQMASKEEPREMSLVEVRDQVEAFLVMQNVQKKLADLRNQADVDTYPHRLKGE